MYNKSFKTRGTKTNLRIFVVILTTVEMKIKTKTVMMCQVQRLNLVLAQTSPSPDFSLSEASGLIACSILQMVSSFTCPLGVLRLISLLLCHTCAYLPQAAQHNRLLISSDALMPGFPDGLDCLHATECKSAVNSACVTRICY